MLALGAMTAARFVPEDFPSTLDCLGYQPLSENDTVAVGSVEGGRRDVPSAIGKLSKSSASPVT